MTEKTLSLGERILLATRLAVEEHLLQSELENMQGGHQVTVGGADLDTVTDDLLMHACGRAIFAFGVTRPVEGKAA
jgi:hypothetical protein